MPSSSSSAPALADGETAFVSVGAMVQGVNFGAMAAPITKAVISPLTKLLSDAFVALFSFFLGADLPSVLETDLSDAIVKELVAATAEPIQKILPASLTEVVVDQARMHAQAHARSS